MAEPDNGLDADLSIIPDTEATAAAAGTALAGGSGGYIPPNPPDPRRLLKAEEIEAILQRDVYGQVEWYDTKARRNISALSFWTWTGFIFGFISTVIAAIPTSLISDTTKADFVKWLIVVATAITTIATGTIAPRYRRLANSRETGRVRTVEIEKLLRIVLTYKPMTDVERYETISSYFKQLMAVESQYGAPDRGQGAELGAGKSAV